MNKDWEIVIGIEIHLELNTKTKMFSSVANEYNALANTNISPIDLAYPGTLPLVNKAAVIKGIKLAKALNMEVAEELHFDRKNYYYPDLPKGYQITQQFHPIGKNGSIKIKVDDVWKEITIERIHLEEDTAKSIHENNLTYLNYNRAGVPLIEIVSNPVIHSAKEACAYIEAIRLTALCLDISDAKMNEGSLRTDVNISVRKCNTNDLNTRVEIKNLNSIANVQKAIEYEATWQIEQHLNNKMFSQQTKRFDEATLKTVTMREKGNALDYKYHPNPNIPIIKLEKSFIDKIQINERPYEKETRYLASSLNLVQISQLLNNVDYANYFDAINYPDLKKAANIFFANIVSYLNETKINIKDLATKPQDTKVLIDLLVNQKIKKNDVSKILDLKQSNPFKTILELVKENNLIILEQEISLPTIVETILKENPSLEVEFTKNFDRANKFLTGQVMKKTAGKANLAELQKLIKEKF
ncbi:Aspartyl/glutamyl-tRNA(Asn/Gln) amidotransferase subunit B [Metamycoplasma arthritidis]|uniref:Aspartyl/glutamyl-tRNA(Asn/Gln) amidotransferase subunit B n=1 Tax=Metamycoplasma arthritidis (strain 158L3-1) TaxID=243272 RepID=B3PLT0_META1|nr:Asp-tRNA(Asn)/Glu-tRNA(Gln) amidotransferase subunit GatB [Metamycoplasma arthritidis]ACF06982.1 glutamyl-tRNA amidotransferase subunit B [Metamycoplasma arthritidis 158L3-1]VEU78511.1 Aspartyl/glutamyl-tRNA(Asn/Gln) amidotransferase subunit B [Metamycoplasma arthritidis]